MTTNKVFRRCCLCLVALTCLGWIRAEQRGSELKADCPWLTEVTDTAKLYETLHLDKVVSLEAFTTALAGYPKVEGVRKPILTLIDFTKPSNEERMAVIDLEHLQVLCTTVVSHGRNSGQLYATQFSNKVGSYMSSLGFYLTGDTYQGGNGYSLRLYGLEEGINDRAYERAIVIHGADYCDPDIVKDGTRLGRSLGCPALPQYLAREVIDTIKEGSVLFIYAADEAYTAQSPYLI